MVVENDQKWERAFAMAMEHYDLELRLVGGDARSACDLLRADSKIKVLILDMDLRDAKIKALNTALGMDVLETVRAERKDVVVIVVTEYWETYQLDATKASRLGPFRIGPFNKKDLVPMGNLEKALGDGLPHFRRLLHEEGFEDIVRRLGEVPAGKTNDFEHSADYRCVKWKDTEFSFTPFQAVVIRALHEAFLKGTPQLGQETLINEVEQAGTVSLSNRRLRDLFRLNASGTSASLIIDAQTVPNLPRKTIHPAWSTISNPKSLIISGKTRGSYRLNL